jgi:hypothetical protein
LCKQSICHPLHFIAHGGHLAFLVLAFDPQKRRQGRKDILIQ